MNNISYLPFERNNYYYGKLMSVDDFDLEQGYHNNKRRMLNRFMNGSGIVSGLNLVVIDDETISLERGIAIDSIGREIVVEDSFTKRLTDIDGYDRLQSENIPYAYLCIEYAEEEKEAVHNIAGRNQERMQEFNKVRERSRLFLTGIEPKQLTTISDEGIDAERILVYDENGIRIHHIMPRYVQKNEEFDFVVEVENMGQTEDFAFSYEVNLMFIKHMVKPDFMSGSLPMPKSEGDGLSDATPLSMPKSEGNGLSDITPLSLDVLRVDFDEKLVNKKMRYKLFYKLSAVNMEGEACAEVSSAGFRLSIGGQALPSKISGISKTNIVSDSLIKHITESYFQYGMDRMMDSKNGYSIYLAKLFLVKAGGTSVIKYAEPVPFNQYVYSSELNHAVIRQLMTEIVQMKHRIEIIEDIPLRNERGFMRDNITAFGVFELDLSGNKKKNWIFTSDEILHGLGVGQIGIILGIENNDGEVIYGKGIHNRINLMAKTYPAKGSFILAVEFIGSYTKDKLRIHWAAMKNPEIEDMSSTGKKLLVYQGMMNMKVRESRYIDVKFINMKDKRISFHVKDQEGIVDKNGLYTAPDKEGIYEVKIESIVYAGVHTSVFMVVREEELYNTTLG